MLSFIWLELLRRKNLSPGGTSVFKVMRLTSSWGQETLSLLNPGAFSLPKQASILAGSKICKSRFSLEEFFALSQVR